MTHCLLVLLRWSAGHWSLGGLLKLRNASFGSQLTSLLLLETNAKSSHALTRLTNFHQLELEATNLSKSKNNIINDKIKKHG